MPDVHNHHTGPLEPVSRLSQAELDARCAALPPASAFIPLDPYRQIDPQAQRVPIYWPQFVQGAPR